MPFSPIVAPEVFAMRPDFTALSLHAEGVKNGPSDAVSRDLLAAALTESAARPWAEAHLEAWREAFRAFGAKPQRTPCSAEALRKRALRDGAPPAINAVVDLYNAVSVGFAVPVGGENLAAYAGAPRLVRATGGEPFDSQADGAPKIEPVDPGEVIWRDDIGVTCRRWNWRQGVRTRLDEDSTDMWFVIERLDPMPMEALLAAGEMLAKGLLRLSPDAHLTTTVIGAEQHR